MFISLSTNILAIMYNLDLYCIPYIYLETSNYSTYVSYLSSCLAIGTLKFQIFYVNYLHPRFFIFATNIMYCL